MDAYLLKERMMILKFTKTQQKILDILADGLPHLRKELWACCPSVQGMDEASIKEFARNRTNVHLMNIRSKLRLVGQDIVCEVVNRRLSYRHVKLLRPNGSDTTLVSPLTALPIT